MKIVPNPSYPTATLVKLSAREFEVFCGIACGLAPQAIADKYGISVKTISTYRQRVMDKLGLKSNQDIAVLAFKEGITVYEEQAGQRSQEKQVLVQTASSEQESAASGGRNTQGSSEAAGENTGEAE